MDDEWTTVISGDRLVKFTDSDLAHVGYFLLLPPPPCRGHRGKASQRKANKTGVRLWT